MSEDIFSKWGANGWMAIYPRPTPDLLLPMTPGHRERVLAVLERPAWYARLWAWVRRA